MHAQTFVHAHRSKVRVGQSHRCENVLYFFIKSRFKFFLFLKHFLFSSGNFFILLSLLKSEIKRLLSDGFNTAAISYRDTFDTRDYEPQLSNVVTHTMAVILLENVSIWFE